jgi:hypothetical protein
VERLPPHDPVGFVSVRLERFGDGVRATVAWNADIEDRTGDRTATFTDPRAAVQAVRSFVDAYVAGSRPS